MMNSFMISSYHQVLLSDRMKGSVVDGACSTWGRSTYMVLVGTHEGKEPIRRQEWMGR